MPPLTPAKLPVAKAGPPQPGDITHLDRTMTGEDALVHDTLCALQAPCGLNRVSEMMAAAGLRTERGTAFNPVEVRRFVDRLVATGHAQRDTQGRVHATQPHAGARFLEMMLDPRRAKAWFEAWRVISRFDHSYSLGYQEEDQLAAAMRLVIFGGASMQHLQRLGQMAYTFTHLWSGALRRAVLEPFDARLFERLDRVLQLNLIDHLMMALSGFAESAAKPLEDWLIARGAAAPDMLPPDLRCRLAESLLFRGDFSGARTLCAEVSGGYADVIRAALHIAQGDWRDGASQFEAALKRAALELGRRKNLASPSMLWFYLMALLASPEPAAWTKARKFAASEVSKGGVDPFGMLGVWLSAIDQRLGDAPQDPSQFHLVPVPRSGLQSLQSLQHLLCAAWLRIEPKAPDKVRAHAQELAARFETAQLRWLARLTRRAATMLLGDAPAAADADTPFFVGQAQDRWREALASIMALGGDAPGPARASAKAEPDRLIWVVNVGADSRIEGIEPMEQKFGTRGLGKPKPVSLATLIKRKDLATHDAALLRAVQREDFGNRPVLDVTTAAPALVRHPFVAWERDPTQFIEIEESLPALEIMTHGEHITFRLLDPIRHDKHRNEDKQDEEMPLRWREQRLKRRNSMLIADGPTRARLVRLTPAQLRVAELVTQGWKVPVAARTELDAALRVLAAHFQVASDAEAGHEVAANPLLRAELTPQGNGLTVALLAAPFGDFGPRLPPGGGRLRVTTVHQGVTLSTRRDLDREREARDKLLALLDMIDFDDERGHEWHLDDPQHALAVVEALSQLSEHIVTEWPKGKPMRVRAAPDASVKLRATSKGEWLELEGELELDSGEVLHLRQLLDLARSSKSRYVALAEGDFLALSDALRQQLNDLAALAQPHKSGQRLSGVAALAWEASGSTLTLEGDAAWRKRSRAWEQAQALVFEAPPNLDADLRDYQLEGYRWLMRLGSSGFGAVLADDMGLGKTVQTLAMLLQRAAGGPALVVAPTSVCGNWLIEAARFAPSLQVELYGDVLLGDEAEGEFDEEAERTVLPLPPAGEGRGEGEGAGAGGQTAHRGQPPALTPALSQREREQEPKTLGLDTDAKSDNPRLAARLRQVRSLGPGQVLICSYALLQIDAEILTEAKWHSIVLDEAQAIKNPATRRAKAAAALQGDFKLALTGTPIENRLGELWSIMGFCNPGLLGSADQFARTFVNPIEREEDPHLKAGASRRLRRLLAPFLLRRTKAQVLTDLPPRTEIVHEVIPGAKERALLEALRQQAQTSVAQAISANAGAGGAKEGQNQFHVLAALTRLRRAACDPRLVAPELGIVGAKVQEFERLATELVAGRHKALVFSQFTDFLALLRERLDMAGLTYQYLDGSTPAAERTKRVAAFQAGASDLFLISLKAGGFGLNLTVADYVIIADPWWNPATEEQASARAHRIGQLRPVTVYRLVTQGSIEEKIVRLHKSKRDLAEGILSGQDAGDAKAPLDAAQLMELLRGE
jgi:SNF2 family DNA or RNA helicase